MPNHVHIVAVPRGADSLGRAFRHVPPYYNRLRVMGHLWKARLSSVAMDERHLHAAFRYGALNQVRARLAKQAIDRRRSSVHALLGDGSHGELTNVGSCASAIPISRR
jgi:putative transposase